MISSTARRRVAVLGTASALAGSIALAAPSEAAPGVFRYQAYANLEERMNNEAPEPEQVMSPPAGECIKTPRGANAENYTVSAVVLYKDAKCKQVATTVKPFDMDASPFESIKAQG